VALEAERYLTGNCLNLFLDSRFQYIARVNGRTAFALAENGGSQICGAANNYDLQDGYFINLPPIDRLEAIAIKRCEAAKPAGFDAPCRIFARGQEIVWKKATSGGMK
jgi:hypothetical protein